MAGHKILLRSLYFVIIINDQLIGKTLPERAGAFLISLKSPHRSFNLDNESEKPYKGGQHGQ